MVEAVLLAVLTTSQNWGGFDWEEATICWPVKQRDLSMVNGNST